MGHMSCKAWTASSHRDFGVEVTMANTNFTCTKVKTWVVDLGVLQDVRSRLVTGRETLVVDRLDLEIVVQE